MFVRRDGKAISAFKCRGLLKSPHEIDAGLARIAMESTFFQQYFVVAPAGEPIKQLADLLYKLELPNVGVLVVDEGEIELYAAPTGDPSPDRRKMLLSDSFAMQRIGAAIHKA
jgi:hypothetical protein